MVLTLVAACASPLRVHRIAARDFYTTQTRSALSSGVSELTRTTLRRHDLLDRYEEAPDETIALLRESLARGRAGSDELFAMAELSLLRAQEEDSRPHYLAAAVYAYAFLFPDDPGDDTDAFDPRVRMACDIYNRSLAKAFRVGSSDAVSLEAGTRSLPLASMTIDFDPRTLAWHGYRLVELTPVDEIEVIGMRNRYHTSGIGVPLAARPEPPGGTYRDEDLVGPNIRVAVTAVLRIDHPRQQILAPAIKGTLEVHATMDEESIRIGPRTVPLEADPTAVIASTLVAAQPWKFEIALFLGDAFPSMNTHSFLRALRPYQPGKIPVVFVHGTASSVFRWADMTNDLLQDRRIRSAYQFWFYTYDSGNPILYSAYKLRQMLSARIADFERDSPDPALHRMVVIGHSQGGLLAKLTAIDSADRFWAGVSSRPFDEVPMTQQTREMLRGAIFVKPLPFVTRLIFICTPHRGSFLAGPQIIRRLVQRLIRLPSDVASIGEEMAGLSSGERYLSLERLPTSIDNMDPGNRLIRALSTIPIARGVAAHSIIAVDRDDDIQHGDDGVVTYESAHIDGVASELVVRSGHSAQANPHTIAEVQRILLDHLASVRAETSSIGTSHRTYPAGSPAMGTRRST